jgi:DNA repair protein RadD
MRPTLFDYQADIVSQIADLQRGERLIALPTGAGKTRTAVTAVLARTAHGGVRRAVWLAPTTELVEQAFDTTRDLWRDFGTLDRLLLTRKLDVPADWSGPTVTFSTPQAVHARVVRRRADFIFDLVVFDEAHQLGADTFRAAVASVRDLGEVPLIGLSATPGRVDSRETEDLVQLFSGNLITSSLLDPNPVRTLQRRGVLARLEFRRLTKRPVNAGDEVRRLRIGLNACRTLVRNPSRVLVFTASIAGAIVLAEALRTFGVAAASVHSGLSRQDRVQRLADFARGDLDVVTNQRLLATGYDCPAITDLLLLSPVSSPILFEQMVGRAARGPLTGGARTATVWELDSHLEMHGLPQSYYRYRDYEWA